MRESSTPGLRGAFFKRREAARATSCWLVSGTVPAVCTCFGLPESPSCAAPAPVAELAGPGSESECEFASSPSSSLFFCSDAAALGLQVAEACEKYWVNRGWSGETEIGFALLLGHRTLPPWGGLKADAEPTEFAAGAAAAAAGAAAAAAGAPAFSPDRK